MPLTAVTSDALMPFRDAQVSQNDIFARGNACHRERTCDTRGMNAARLATTRITTGCRCLCLSVPVYGSIVGNLLVGEPQNGMLVGYAASPKSNQH